VITATLPLSFPIAPSFLRSFRLQLTRVRCQPAYLLDFCSEC
jgi:hypothetical protein